MKKRTNKTIKINSYTYKKAQNINFKFNPIKKSTNNEQMGIKIDTWIRKILIKNYKSKPKLFAITVYYIMENQFRNISGEQRSGKWRERLTSEKRMMCQQEEEKRETSWKRRRMVDGCDRAAIGQRNFRRWGLIGPP